MIWKKKRREEEEKREKERGLVDSTFQKFSVFYRQQYSAAYFRHLHQEVEPKKEGRSLLLTPQPQYAPEEVLYQGSVKFSCWDEQGKKCRERYTVLRRDYKVEIHENMETFNRGCAAKLILQPAGGSVFTTEEASRAYLEQTCVGLLNGVKEDSSSVVSSPDVFAVYLHLPYMGHTCFLFQQDKEQDHFQSALNTCIRHCNLASIQTKSNPFRQVLASQVMEEVLPWLQSQLQSRVKGKKTERIRQWLATVQATYTLVLEQLTASLETLRGECRETASASQALIRSDLDQIMSSHCFLAEKVRACVCEEAEKVCSESVAPYMSSILEALTENISTGIHEMQHTLRTQMDSAFTHANGGTEETNKALSSLCSISLAQCYLHVENLTEKLEGLKQRFGLSSTQRLIHSAHLEMEKLLGSAVYTFELFLQSSARLQPSQTPVKMERAKERVLKQLDYDSRVVQRRLYQEALLEITLPVLTRRMDNKWKTELQQFEQYIFSDYSSFILVRNVYDGVLRDILTKEIDTVVQDAASKKSNNLSLDTSDLGMSQYSLLGQTPPRSAPSSPAIHTRDSSSATPSEDPAPVAEEGGQTVTADVCFQSEPEHKADARSDPSPTHSSDQKTVLVSPVIVVTEQFDASPTEEAPCIEETQEEAQLRTETPTTHELSNSATSDSDEAVAQEVCTSDAPANPESTNPIPLSDPSLPTPSLPQSTDVPAESAYSDQSATPENSDTPELPVSDHMTQDATSLQHPYPSSSQPPCKNSQMTISLGSLSEAIGCSSITPSEIQTMAQQTTDRAVYLTGEIKDNWEVERVKMEMEAAEEEGANERTKEGKEEEIEEERSEGPMGDEPAEGSPSAESPAESATALTTEQGKEEVDDEEGGSELKTERRKVEGEAEDKGPVEKEEKMEEEEEKKKGVLQSPQPMDSQPDTADELPLDSVAIIRELVTEITEVETIVKPDPSSSHTL
ncbi:hypothetical protein L3Q82_006300 [Scortum barcoo]|uniref:Uncharacterized protein n=1 Tax=Scortum barcoo TaxID=214431 RepID=A0ACB8X317_9TELE|nr:hypothetical protein L3Q82_006300 [Scortum barcoo]